MKERDRGLWKIDLMYIHIKYIFINTNCLNAQSLLYKSMVLCHPSVSCQLSPVTCPRASPIPTPAEPAARARRRCTDMSKRRCAFLDCDGVEGVQRLYSFPVREPDNCREWVRRSGNLKLAGMSLEALKRKYVCEKHFTSNSFKSSARKYLWPDAKPMYAADGQMLEDVDRSAVEQVWVPGSNTHNGRKTSTCGDGPAEVNTPGSKQEVKFLASEKEQLPVCEKQLKLKEHSTEEQEHLLPRPAPSAQASMNRKKDNTGYSRKRTCSFPNCDSMEGEQHLFAFPVHEPKICREWARRTGDPALLGLPPEYLIRKYACENHFSLRSFVTSARRRLRPNVKPVYATDGQLLESVDETEAQRQCPKQKRRLKELLGKRRKAITQGELRSATKKPEPELSESSEDTETGTSPECVPIPAGAMLGKMYSGNMSDVCSLCLCEDGKLLPNTTVYLKDDYTEGNFSLKMLVREMQLDKIISRNAFDSFCEICVQQLSLFYLFKSKCTKLASGLTNFYKFSESTKDYTTVVLPFETIQEYLIKDENLGYLVTKLKVEASSDEERLDNQSNLGEIPIHDFSTNEQYSVSVSNGEHIINENQSNPLKSIFKVNLKMSKVTRQSELNRYSTVAKCIVQGKSYCSCCLTENQALLEVLETMLLTEGQNEIVPLKDILLGVVSNKTTREVPSLICQDCLNVTINAYNFQTMFDKSTTIVQNCISCFETCLTNTENVDLPDEVTSIHLNFYEHFNDIIWPIHIENESYSSATEVIKLEIEQSEISNTNSSVKKSEELTTACHICGQGFYSFDEVQLHISGQHDDLVYCHYCNKNYKAQNKSLLIYHIAKCQTTETPYECDLCDMKFTKRNLIEAHRLRHFPKTIKCDYCPVMFYKQQDQYFHKLRMHRELLQPSYECSICHSVFSKRTELREHKATHPADAMHTCKYCGASWNMKQSSSHNSHICPRKVMSWKTNGNQNKETNNIVYDVKKLKYNDSESTVCDICGVVLKSHKQIEIHRKKHMQIKENPDSDTMPDKSNNKTAMCELCGRLFRDMRSVDRHVKSCSKITTEKQCLIGPDGIQKKTRKTLECQHCPYKTTAKTCLERHINANHLKIRPYKCSVCEKSSYTKLLLKVHKQIHTQITDEFKCNVCGGLFKNKVCLKLHMRLHTGERPYPCDFCDKKFISAGRRQCHRTRRHFEPTVQCNICLKFFYFQKDLRDHVRKSHSDGSNKTRSERKLHKIKQHLEVYI